VFELAVQCVGFADIHQEVLDVTLPPAVVAVGWWLTIPLSSAHPLQWYVVEVIVRGSWGVSLNCQSLGALQ